MTNQTECELLKVDRHANEVASEISKNIMLRMSNVTTVLASRHY